MELFAKEDRATKNYSIAHVAAFNMVAALCRCWKFKYLFHDFEKPFLMLLWHDYKRVQKYHRNHNSHHLEYTGAHDYISMCIDWECSKYTKSNSQLNCTQTIVWYIKRNIPEELSVLYSDIPNYKVSSAFIDTWEIVKVAKQLGLWDKNEFDKTMKLSIDEINKLKIKQ